ncbi:serine hydrolase domain-containing protein [Streptomyces sp. NPDC008163]|uniref:serine hydrolase domain-containing protein n=1 Tax=Streptomyces sp. NPDC008163 TaxID=3364818 RepID=UPI0036E4AB9A
MIKHKRTLSGAVALAVAFGVAAGTQSGGAAVAAERPAAAATARLPAVLHRLTTVDGAPGALAEARGRRGNTVLTGGVADIDSGAPVRGDSRFRIGSMTKPFVATVVLQLVGEDRVALDAPVERYLPDVVRDHPGDWRGVTVRRLLQHTSGLPDYLDFLNPQDVLADPLAHHDTRDLVDLALDQPRTFRPGHGWDYSNTNYLLSGMLIEKVTGRPYGEEIRRRIIEPLGLTATSVPGDDPAIPGPHPRGYVRPGEEAPLMDATAINPSVAGASGEMVSSASDLNRFLGALLGGRLLEPAQLGEMMKARPVGDGRAYGLGLERRWLPCGGSYWGHGGDIFGFQTAGGATVDGRQTSVMVNLDPGGTEAQDDDVEAAVEAGLCGARG